MLAPAVVGAKVSRSGRMWCTKVNQCKPISVDNTTRPRIPWIYAISGAQQICKVVSASSHYEIHEHSSTHEESSMT
jgi:hypothetical protein